MNQTDRLLTPSTSHGCYLVTGERGKKWIFPQKNTSVGVLLYNPFSPEGLSVKPLLGDALRNGTSLSGITVENVNVELETSLREKITDVFGVKDFEWSLFGGTPSIHQKVVIQVFTGCEILGYVKVGDNEEVKSLFDHEEKVLHRVESLNVPEVLYNRDGIFIQTTQRTVDSATTHLWTPDHQKFIEKLYETSRHAALFEDSDFYSVMQAVEPYLKELPAHQQEIINRRRAEVVDRYRGKIVEYGIYHGDFTPWNMIVNPGDGLFVFDWEYSRMNYPPMLDKWHYIVQTAIFDRQLSHDEIYEKMSPNFSEETFKLYLLDVICHFTERERGHFPGCMGQSQELWCRMLNACE